LHSFSIIIVSWNALHHLKEYLPSVAATDYPDFEIILSDNNSDDGSVSWVQEHYPDVRVVELDKNYGYCGGNNRAAHHADGDITVFLNNDVRVSPDWLTELDKTFRRLPNATVLQPKIRADKSPDHFEYAGAAGGCIDKFGYPFCRGRVFDTIEEDSGQYDEPTEIFWASGAAMAVRTDHFEQLGGFDEDFEFHMEEIDFCWRTWNAGEKIYYCPGSIVYHLGGGSLPMGHPRKVRYNFRNNLIMMCKNLPAAQLLTRFPVRYLLDVIAALRNLLSGQIDDCKAIVQAHQQFWKMWPETIKKRSRLQSRRRLPQLQPQPPVKNISVVSIVPDSGWYFNGEYVL